MKDFITIHVLASAVP